jgi:hypothetical protein
VIGTAFIDSPLSSIHHATTGHLTGLGAMITSNSGWAGMMVLVVVIVDAPQS